MDVSQKEADLDIRKLLPNLDTSESFDSVRTTSEGAATAKDKARSLNSTIGRALTQDNRLIDALASLARHEASLISGLTRLSTYYSHSADN